VLGCPPGFVTTGAGVVVVVVVVLVVGAGLLVTTGLPSFPFGFAPWIR
jgi:hypothetical protein